MTGTVKITRFWCMHDSKRDRLHLNKEFRLREKEYIRKFKGSLTELHNAGMEDLVNNQVNIDVPIQKSIISLSPSVPGKWYRRSVQAF